MFWWVLRVWGGRSRVAALFISKGVVIIFCVSWVWGECGHSWLYVIVHKQIRAYTPRHNGKAERSHRKDNERFYSKHSFYSLADLQDQLKRYNREYNHTPMRPLGWKSPNQYLADYFNNKSVTDV